MNTDYALVRKCCSIIKNSDQLNNFTKLSKARLIFSIFSMKSARAWWTLLSKWPKIGQFFSQSFGFQQKHFFQILVRSTSITYFMISLVIRRSNLTVFTLNLEAHYVATALSHKTPDECFYVLRKSFFIYNSFFSIFCNVFSKSIFRNT